MSTVERWVERARYDLATARTLLDGQRYLYVIFCCQQAVEKALKAVIIQQTGTFPPRIHNLPRLAEIACLDIDKKRTEILAMLSDYYIESRYPQELVYLDKHLNHRTATLALDESEEICQWLFSKLT